MRPMKPWVSALGVSETNFRSWSEHMPATHSITYWCLLDKKIKAADYLAWAKEYYQLPVLQSAYFAQPAALDFWQQIRSVANWSEELLPIAFWDGVVFIGCVEPPPAELSWSFPVQFILASAHDLHSLWQKYHPEEKVSVQSSSSEKTTIEISPHTEDEIVIVNEVSAPTQKPVQAFPSLPDLPPPAFDDGPAGLKINLEKSVVRSNPVGLDLSAKTKTVNLEVPEGLKLDLPETATSVTEVIVQSSVHAKEEGSKTIPIATLDPLPSQKAVDENSFASTITQLTKVKEVTMAGSSADKMAVLVTTDAAPVANPEDAKNISDVLTWAFSQFHTHFSCCMLMKFENGSLTPWKRDWRWQNPKDIGAIDTELPSIFRVVFRTRLPYHGYVVSSPINDDFFKFYKFSGLPEHVTACPVVVHEELFGIFLAVGDKKANSKEVLLFAERTIERMCKVLKAFIPRIAA